MTPSFVQGLDTALLRFETIGQALDATAVKWGSQDALIVPAPKHPLDLHRIQAPC